MAYTTVQKIINMGFSWHNFDVPDGSAFEALVQTTLDEQITLIQVDYPAYEAATGREQLVLAQAEKYRTAAALKRLEGNQASADSSRDFGAPPANTENHFKSAQQFENSADIWLAKIGVGKHVVKESTGIASAVVVTG